MKELYIKTSQLKLIFGMFIFSFEKYYLLARLKMETELMMISVFLLFIIFIFVLLGLHISKKLQMNRALEIFEGMYDTEAFDRIGKFYDKRLTENGEDVYYWFLPKSNGVKYVELKIRNHRVSQITART